MNNTNEIVLANNSNVDRSYNYSSKQNKSKATDSSTEEITKDAFPRPGLSKKFSFHSIPKCNLVNINTLESRHSLQIATKRKLLDPILNHVWFVYIVEAPEEDIDSMKETFAFKEAMNSLYKKEFMVAMEKEVLNYTVESIRRIKKGRIFNILRY